MVKRETVRLHVNETRIHAIGRPDLNEWWFWFRARAEKAGRVRVEGVALTSDSVSLHCDSEQDAEITAQLLVARGVPHTAISVKRSHS